MRVQHRWGCSLPAACCFITVVAGCRSLDDDPTACSVDPGCGVDAGIDVHGSDSGAALDVDSAHDSSPQDIGEENDSPAQADSGHDSLVDSFDAGDVHDAESCVPATHCTSGTDCGTEPDGCGGTVRCGPDTCTGVGA